MKFSINLFKKKQKDIIKVITIYFIFEKNKLLFEPVYFGSKNEIYFKTFEKYPDEVEDIYKTCLEQIDLMKSENKNIQVEKFDLLKYTNSKTYSGSSRKMESMQFLWNNFEGYIFCKGERNTAGFTYYKEKVFGNNVTFEDFKTVFENRIKKIQKKHQEKVNK